MVAAEAEAASLATSSAVSVEADSAWEVALGREAATAEVAAVARLAGWAEATEAWSRSAFPR
jgi:hypothetical protein